MIHCTLKLLMINDNKTYSSTNEYIFLRIFQL